MSRRLTSLRACICFAIVGLTTILGNPPAGIAQETSEKSKQTSGPWSIEPQAGRLILKHQGNALTIFHYQDEQCLRPFFSHVHTPTGKQVTRNHPPNPGLDPDDHANMHCGIWLGFGDINGQDFWRNKARIRHRRFLSDPSVESDRIAFDSEDELIDSQGKSIGSVVQTYRLNRIDSGCLLVWQAIFTAGSEALSFGDQEEMGLGVRVATSMTEKNSGRILSNNGKTGAKETWGKKAQWVDYSKTVDGKRIGILLMPDTKNPQASWFHNRDYGLMVANCFGNKSFTGGEPSVIRIEANRSMTIRYGVYWYDTRPEDPLPIEKIRSAIDARQEAR
ncbi:MAG: PmoA family protein [Planctomycetota bacterium]|nr:PmoA family protein [Planctomycetota bacterium]